MRDAGGQRGVGPDDRHKPGQHHCRATVALEELLRLGQVRGLQDPGIIFEPPAAKLPSQQVAHLVAGHRRRGHNADQERESEVQLLMEQASCEEERVSGQEREQDAGFDEHHPGDDRQGGRSQALQETGGIEGRGSRSGGRHRGQCMKCLHNAFRRAGTAKEGTAGLPR